MLPRFADPNLLYVAVSSEVKVLDLRASTGVARSFSHSKEEVNQVGCRSRRVRRGP